MPQKIHARIGLEHDNVFFRGDYQIVEHHSVAAFAYWLDIDDDGPYPAGKTVNLSSDTYGLEYKGKFDRLSVAAAFATQSEAGHSEPNLVRFEPELLRAGYPVLPGPSGYLRW